jgi:PAS domain S-box-containing protein
LLVGKIEFDLNTGAETMQDKPRESNENNFMALLNFIADPAVIVDEKGHLLLVNKALEEITGLSKKEVIGKAFLELNLLPPKSKEIILENLRKRMQGLPVEPYEITFADKTGETRYAEVKAKKIDYTGQPADLVIFRDVTRRKQNAKRLREYAEKMEALVNEKVKEIEESEEKYRELTESISDVFFAVDKDLRYTYWNKASEKLTGILAKDAIGKSLTEVFPDVKGTRVEQCYREVLRTKQSQSFLNKYRIGDKDFVFEINAYPTIDGLSVFVKDITERKKMEATIKQERDMLESVTENIGAGFVTISKDYRVLWANEFIRRYKGDVEGKLCYATLNTLDHICPDCGVKKVFEDGVTLDTHEYNSTDIKGNDYWVELIATPIKDKDGNVIAALELAVDITKKKRMQSELAEYSQKLEQLAVKRTEELEKTQEHLRHTEERAREELEASEERYRSLCEDATVLMLRLDRKGKVTYTNRIVNDYGLAKEDIIGKSMLKFVPLKDRLRLARAHLRVIRGENDEGETEISTPKGKVAVDYWSNPIREGGKIVGCETIIRDVTEKKEMEKKLHEYTTQLEAKVEERTAELRASRDELAHHSEHLEELVEEKTRKLRQAQRMATIGELAAMVGHDLRNPLTGIKGATYYLKTKHGAEMDVRAKEMLEIIEKDIDCSNKIINDLLDYSSNLTLELVNTTPKLLLKNALSLIEVPERIKIMDATEDKPKIKVDAGKMNRAFVNIITNAVDAMPESGTLTVTSKAVKDNVEIVFKDTGTGMSEETLSKLKLWSPLFTTKAKGMGFGLPVCKRVVEAHGGKISVESTLGKGTTVTLTIPVNPQPVNEGEEKWIFNESWLSATPTAEGAP